MSREIKFEYGFEGINGIIKKVYNLSEIPRIKHKCDVWDSLPLIYVREFTGLKDKNGVDIYEGDILSNEFNAIGNVSFKNGMFVVDFKYDETLLTKDNYTGCFRLYVVNMITKVISNIHENPELLK